MSNRNTKYLGICFLLLMSGVFLGWTLRGQFTYNRTNEGVVNNEATTDLDSITGENSGMSVTTTSSPNIDVSETESDIGTTEEVDSNNSSNDTNTINETEKVVSQLTIDSVKNVLSLDAEYSIVSISPDSAKAAYIDYVTFEALGNAFIFDAATVKVTPITQLSYDQENTAKKIVWLDNETVALIIGYRNGTITQGGDVYIYELNTGNLELKLKAENKTEYVDLQVYDETVKIRMVRWTDDNLTQYVYEDLYIPILDF